MMNIFTVNFFYKINFLIILVFFCEVTLAQDSPLPLIPRDTTYYTNGQNGIELIAKQNDKTIIVSTFDSKAILKEAVAHQTFELFVAKTIVRDTIISVRTEDAIVTGNCKINLINNITNISFYFHKINWNSGLVEIHKGEEFIPMASSDPFVQPAIIRKIVASKKKKKNK